MRKSNKIKEIRKYLGKKYSKEFAEAYFLIEPKVQEYKSKGDQASAINLLRSKMELTAFEALVFLNTKLR